MGEFSTPETETRFRRLATTTAFAGLFSYAIVLFITPASNNEIGMFYNASLSMLGWLPLTLMAGFFTAVLWSGGFSDKHGKLPVVTAGCAVMAAGAFLFGQSSHYGMALAANILMGIGGGMSEATAMALLFDLYSGHQRTSVMNLSQAMFGVGAIVSPLAIGWLIGSGMNWQLGYLGATLVCTVSAAIGAAAVCAGRETSPGMHEQGEHWKRVLSDWRILWLAIGIMVYVGAEIGQSNWLSVYLKRNLHAGESLAASGLSFMWFGIGVGRLGIAWLGRHISELTIIRGCLALAAVSQAALLLAGSPIGGLASAFALGLFLGPVFPTIVSCAGEAYPRQSGTVTSIVIAAGSLGAAVFPAAIGQIAYAIHDLRPALWTCFGLLAANTLLFARFRMQRPPNSFDRTS